MRAKIQRTVPTDHPIFIGAPPSAAERGAFNRVKMTQLLRDNVENMGFSGIRIDKATSRGVSHYEFILNGPGILADDFSVALDASADFTEEYEVVDDTLPFEGESEAAAEPEEETDEESESAAEAAAEAEAEGS